MLKKSFIQINYQHSQKRKELELLNLSLRNRDKRVGIEERIIDISEGCVGSEGITKYYAKYLLPTSVIRSNLC